MKKIFSTLLSAVLVCGCAFGLSACGEKVGEGGSYERDGKLIVGYNEMNSQVNAGVEACLTSQHIADLGKALGLKDYRLAVRLGSVFNVGPNNVITFNENSLAQYHDWVDKMTAAGVTNILANFSSNLKPYGYEVTADTVVPDPATETEAYLTYLALNGRAVKMFAQEFPEITTYRVYNEPDVNKSAQVNKNGYVYGAKEGANDEFMYVDKRETARIMVDLSWYYYQNLKAVNPDIKLVAPGLCGYRTTINYLEYMYEHIESGCIPTGQSFSDTNPDHYFDILAWHPYLLGDNNGVSTMDERWVELQKEIYQVAIDHGDGEKPVWFTEGGFSDANAYSKGEETAAKMVVDMLNYINDDLKFVEKMFLWRAEDLTINKYADAQENHFGMFRCIRDAGEQEEGKPTKYAGEPKPYGVAIYQWVHGKKADLTSLFAFVKEEDKAASMQKYQNVYYV